MALKIENRKNLSVRIPLIGPVYHRDDNLLGSSVPPTKDTIDQKFVNCLFRQESSPNTKDLQISVHKRPGWDTGTTVSNMASNMMYAANFGELAGNYLIHRDTSDANLIRLSVGATNLGSVAVTGPLIGSLITPYNETSFLGAYIQYCSSNSDNKAWSINFSTGAFTQITDTDFTALLTSNTGFTGNFVYKNGYLFVITRTGNIYNSNNADVTAWGASSFVSTSTSANGSNLALYNNTIAAFGINYIEFFEDVGNASGSPLKRLAHLDIQGWGLDEGFTNTVLEAYDTVFWVNNSFSDSGVGIYMLDNFKPKKISTSSIDQELQHMSSGTVVLAGKATLGGYSYIFVYSSDGTNDTLFVYNLELNIWSTWELGFSNLPEPSKLFIRNFGPTTFRIYNTTKFHDMVWSYYTAPRIFTDNGNAYTFEILTSKIDFNTENRKTLHKLNLIGNDSGAASTTSISWSDDDYQTFNTARTVDLNNQRTYLSNCGMFRRRAFRIVNSANTSVSLSALEFNYTLMDS